ncbi:MAG TPA: PAS domain S-box protein [Anaerolineales bacterium]|nr:PAS domain S-box protein [Anaerolineales bacterium]
MNFQYSPVAFVLLITALISIFIAFYIWPQRKTRGVTALIILSLSAAQWLIFYALEVSAIDLETKFFWGKLEYVGIVLAPLSWLLFSLDYAGLERFLGRRAIVVYSIIPAITIALAVTTEYHGLIWSEYHIEYLANFSALGVTHGLWFWVHFSYSYIILLIGTALLIRVFLSRQEGMYRSQGVALLVASLAPWIGNALYLTGNSPIPNLDPTPFAFTISIAALAWAIFGLHLADITPLARDLVIDSMREGMIVLDARNNVIDINTAASLMIGVSIPDAIGKTAADVFSPWPHLIEKFRSAVDVNQEIAVGTGDSQRRYQVRFSALTGQQDELLGRVIMLRSLDESLVLAPKVQTEKSASRSMLEADTQPQADSPRNIFSLLYNFFFAPAKTDQKAPANMNPGWFQARERSFTIITRVSALIGSIVFIFVFFFMDDAELQRVNLIYGVAVVLLWSFGLLRTLDFNYRAFLFLLMVYALAVVETINYGFSVESFIFFTAFVVTAVVLIGRSGGWMAAAISLFSLFIFNWLIGTRYFIPVNLTLETVVPPDFGSGLTSLLVFSASSLAMVSSITILMESLNRAWQSELQSSNLLQQERDLLEQRVDERTQDLEDARDSAVRSNIELRKYYRVIEQSGNSIVITDLDGNIQYANPRFEEVSGYALEEVLGKNPRILKSGRQKPEFYEKMWRTISSGHIWTGVFHNRRKDGTLYWESATIAPVLDQDNVVVNYVAIKEDITSRREVESQLRKLSRAVEQSGNTVIIMDRNGLIEYVNPKFTEVTGYSPEEAAGKSPIALMQQVEEIPDFREDDWWFTVNNGQIWQGEFRNHRKDGSVFWESASIAPVHGRDGEITNFIEIKQDVTEQKILQEQLQKQNDYLSILHQVTLDLLNRRDLTDLLKTIVTHSALLLDAPFSELMLVEGDKLVVKAVTDNQLDILEEKVGRDQASLSWKAFDTLQPVLLEDYSTWSGHRPKYDDFQLHAVADFPVVAGDHCFGVLALGRNKPDYPFTPEQTQTGILFARLVALVLDNVNLYDSAMQEIMERERVQASLQRSNQQQQVINSLLKVSLENRSMDEVLGSILDEILSIDWLTISPKGGVFLFNKQTNLLELRTHRNLSPHLQSLCAGVALGHCLCGRAAQTRQIQFADCLDERHETRYEGIEEHGHYNIPIVDGEDILGVIVLYLPHGYQKSENDLVFLNSVADAVKGIMQRKQAETLLLESEIRFRQIVENASDIIYRADINGNFTYANPSALKMMGFMSEKDVIGKNYLDLTTSEYRQKLKRVYDHQYISKTMSTYHEFPAVAADGGIVWVGQNVQLIMDGDKIIGFQAVARNITQLKQAQEALALSRDQALEASRFKSQLVSRVSHELRTPLGGILGYAELLQVEAFGGLNEKQQAALKNIVESTNFLTTTVNDLLDQAQIESKSLSLHNAYFSPATLLSKISAPMSVLAEKKGLKFRTEISPSLPLELYGDEKRLQQVIINLAGNAIKFTSAGEVYINVSSPIPAYWAIEVRDTGVGIPENEQANIFEPFRQVSNSITRENRGSGLGLAIVRQLVELMGGQISLQSESGKGSIFTVTLPLINAPGE